MLVHKIWDEKANWPYGGALKEKRTKEGWFLFGIIPLFVRTLNLTTYG